MAKVLFLHFFNLIYTSQVLFLQIITASCYLSHLYSSLSKFPPWPGNYWGRGRGGGGPGRACLRLASSVPKGHPTSQTPVRAGREGSLHRSHFLICLSARCLARSQALWLAAPSTKLILSVRSTGRAVPQPPPTPTPPGHFWILLAQHFPGARPPTARAPFPRLT